MHLFFLALLVAFLSGVSLFWFAFLNDHPALKARLRAVSSFFVCGVCQVFWGALLLSLIFNPLQGLAIPARFALPAPVAEILIMLLTWQLIAVAACAVRYLVLTPIESLKYLLKKNA